MPQPDDQGLLHELLTTPAPTQSSVRRPKQLRSLHQQRSEALRGYRFRGVFDVLLRSAERLLFLAVLVFFGYWVFDGYVRDWWHARQNPETNPIAWDSIQPGASASELDAVLGQSLPFVTQAKASAAPPPDYLIPAQVFDLPAASTPTPADPRPIRIIIRAMELDSTIKEVFLHDGAWEVAEYAVGYHHGTAVPGAGNTVLAGHAGFRGGVFARLHELQIGHDIYVETVDTRFHYRVVSTFSVGPSQVEVMYPTSTAQITMITCTAWDTQRLIVVAELVDQAPLSSQAGGGR